MKINLQLTLLLAALALCLSIDCSSDSSWPVADSGSYLECYGDCNEGCNTQSNGQQNGCNYGYTERNRGCRKICFRDCSAMNRKTIIHTYTGLILTVQTKQGSIYGSGIRLAMQDADDDSTNFELDPSGYIKHVKSGFCLQDPGVQDEHITLQPCGFCFPWKFIEVGHPRKGKGKQLQSMRPHGDQKTWCLNLQGDHWDSEHNLIICPCEGDGTHNVFWAGGNQGKLTPSLRGNLRGNLTLDFVTNSSSFSSQTQ